MYTNDQRCRLWLAFSDSLTYKGKARLLQHAGSASQAFEGFSISFQQLVGPKAYEELAQLKREGLDALEQTLASSHIQVLFQEDAVFPQLLKEIIDPPDLFFYRGTMASPQEKALAIIGSRRETRYGREQARGIARDLAGQGVTIVSGLAYGIDHAAHQGALDAGGRTIAVLGSGLYNLYPRDHGPLAEQIVQSGGAVISELPPHSQPLAYHFPFRNRIVSGLSQGVLLIEAREKSGTLITVGHALAQGREVFALPGPVDSPGSMVPHRFLREGARLATCAQDILEDMGWDQREEQLALPLELSLPDLTNIQQRIYDALCGEPQSFDSLLSHTGLSASELNTQMVILEMQGITDTLPGRQYRLHQAKP